MGQNFQERDSESYKHRRFNKFPQHMVRLIIVMNLNFDCRKVIVAVHLENKKVEK